MTVSDSTTLLAQYANGQNDPVKATTACLAAINQKNPRLNAFTTKASTPLDEARAAQKRWQSGTPLGPLDGVPIIVKDNLHVTGLPTSWGNSVLAKLVRKEDQAAVKALRNAGAIILGKGNTPEFAIEGYTANDTFGVTRNAIAPDLTPGGSSGGVVSAVASGMAYAGLATDGGGSIRRPAGFTGLWGLRTGLGSVSQIGGPPQILLDFETIGPITRSARDLSLLYKVLSRKPQRTPRPIKSILAVSHIAGAPCDPEIHSVFNDTTTRLGRMGCNIVKGELPIDLAPLNEIWAHISEIGLAQVFHNHPAVAESASAKYRKIASGAADRSAVELYSIIQIVLGLREACHELWGYDAILMPTSAANPWSADQPFPETIDGKPVGARGHAVYTGWVNAAGLPAVAFPTTVHASLSVGMQLVGRPDSEWDLLGFAERMDSFTQQWSAQNKAYLT